ncbi:hypothetical protein B0H15DRAFT_955700 [Mycena belliarum]|uniref:BAG domain-containing protein n=1 Tax=Mycena belliarum TaxID=1033014 RepID=A0AAD6TS10_9AGAR|nr:hypothetical protein B0H15DRAFT_955700 [Mycena belliae]
MTRLPYAPIPSHLAPHVLDEAAHNWAVWEKTVRACLILAGLDAHLSGAIPCPDPTADPAAAAHWHENDRAVVSFLALKASRDEQLYIASHAQGGAQAVWDALLARHFDAAAQIRLLCEAFSVRYGTEPPAATSARIDALATRAFALGPIRKNTLVSALTVHAVQGDAQGAVPGARTEPALDAERTVLATLTAELTTLRRDLLPAVEAFAQASSTEEAQWTRLLERLFQALGRVDALTIAPGWGQAIADRREVLDEIHRLQCMLESYNRREDPLAQPASDTEQHAMVSIATEMVHVENDFAPAVARHLERGPDERQRSGLIELLEQSLVRLDGITLKPEWEEVRTRRKCAVDEVQRLLNTLDRSSQSATPNPSSAVVGAEQNVIARIAAELDNVRSLLAPAVGTFPRPPSLQTDEQERRHLLRQLSETLERLDAISIETNWEQARKERWGVVKAVKELLGTLQDLPTCAEEQAALHAFASERSNTQALLTPAVTDFLESPSDREQLRLSELLLQALERLDAVGLESAWTQARTARRKAVKEVQALQISIEPPPPSTASSTGENLALSAIASEMSKIQNELSPAITTFARTFQLSDRGPREKERLRLSELSLRFLERLDAISVESGWDDARRQRKSAVKEVQALQTRLDAL